MPDEPPIAAFRSVDILVRGGDGRTLLQMRDGRGDAALTWGFWGGAVETSDASLASCAVRELAEELRVETETDDFSFIASRGRREGHLAALLLCRRPLGWTDIDIREGAGAGFFWRSEMLRLPMSTPLREHLAGRADLFIERPGPPP